MLGQTQMRSSVVLLVASLVAAPAAADESTRWTLEAAIARAVDRSDTLEAAEARQAIAAARIDRARSALWGEVTVGASLTRRAREVTRQVGDDDVTIQSAYAYGAELTGR